MALSNLPRKHLLIGAALSIGMGLFFGAVAYLGPNYQLRPSTGQPYAISDFTHWLIDIFGPTGAALVFVILGASGAIALLRLARNASR